MGARLTKDDWTQFGLRELAKQGYHRLKAQTLAKKLGVSRGSFYWHFKDIADFEQSVLELWKTQATAQISSANNELRDNNERLTALIELVLTPSSIERAIRSWSVVDTSVAKTVSHIDKFRYAYIEKILKDIDVDKNEIESRALLLYWAGIGQTLLGDQNHNSMSSSNVKRLAALMA